MTFDFQDHARRTHQAHLDTHHAAHQAHLDAHHDAQQRSEWQRRSTLQGREHVHGPGGSAAGRFVAGLLTAIMVAAVLLFIGWIVLSEVLPVG